MKKLSRYIKDRMFEEHIVKVKIPYSQFSTFDEFLDMNDKTIETVTEKEIRDFDRLKTNTCAFIYYTKDVIFFCTLFYKEGDDTSGFSHEDLN